MLPSSVMLLECIHYRLFGSSFMQKALQSFMNAFLFIWPFQVHVLEDQPVLQQVQLCHLTLARLVSLREIADDHFRHCSMKGLEADLMLPLKAVTALHCSTPGDFTM